MPSIQLQQQAFNITGVAFGDITVTAAAGSNIGNLYPQLIGYAVGPGGTPASKKLVVSSVVSPGVIRCLASSFSGTGSAGQAFDFSGYNNGAIYFESQLASVTEIYISNNQVLGGDLSGQLPNPTDIALHESGGQQLTFGSIPDASVIERSGTTVVGSTADKTKLNNLNTMSTQAASTVAITGGSVTGLTTLGVRDTSAAHDVQVAAVSSVALTADRTLTLDVVNAAKTVKISANAEIGGVNTGDQTTTSLGLNNVTNDAQVKRSEMGAVNGVATLGSDQKLTAAQLPDLAITDFLGTVATQEAMLALTGQVGDWCSRSDTGVVWIITGATPTLIGSWTQLTYPGAPTDATIITTDVATNNASTTKHGWQPKAVAPPANQLNVVGIANGETATSNKTIIGATTPSTQAFGDSAAHGTSVEASAADHKHAMPANPTSVTYDAAVSAVASVNVTGLSSAKRYKIVLTAATTAGGGFIIAPNGSDTGSFADLKRFGASDVAVTSLACGYADTSNVVTMTIDIAPRKNGVSVVTAQAGSRASTWGVGSTMTMNGSTTTDFTSLTFSIGAGTMTGWLYIIEQAL